MIRDLGVTLLLVFCLIVLTAGVADYVVERRGGDLIKDDNPAEELVEDIFEDCTGIQIDVSPDTLEKK